MRAVFFQSANNVLLPLSSICQVIISKRRISLAYYSYSEIFDKEEYFPKAFIHVAVREIKVVKRNFYLQSFFLTIKISVRLWVILRYIQVVQFAAKKLSF
jgi:hypothetical protein